MPYNGLYQTYQQPSPYASPYQAYTPYGTSYPFPGNYSGTGMQNPTAVTAGPQQGQAQSLSRQALKGWPVFSEDEARKAVIDLDGSIYVFPDFNHGFVYTKQINTADFSPVFRTFKIQESVKAEEHTSSIDMSSFVSRSDYEQLVQAFYQLQNDVAQLHSQASQIAQAPQKRSRSTEEQK